MGMVEEERVQGPAQLVEVVGAEEVVEEQGLGQEPSCCS
jgi:hypothetical protein